MKNFIRRFLYEIQNPKIWIVLMYALLLYFLAGDWGQLIVRGIIAIVILWAIFHLLDRFIFDPIIRRMAEREERETRKRLHELSPRMHL